MYPLKFKNIYFEKIWGGHKLKEYRENGPKGPIGESWDIACHKNGMSIVENGKYAGMTLEEIINILGERIIGKKLNKKDFKYKDFPFLVKIINSNENLSIQVHPDDRYASVCEDDNGKLEAWYIIDCEKNSEIVLGVKACSKENLIEGCQSGFLEKYINKIKVSPGDLFLIEPGLVHSIGKGILLAEFQQNSDVTYRVYDYNRGRELHINKALDVIKVDMKSHKIVLQNSEKIERAIHRPCFNIDIYNVDGSIIENSSIDKFCIYTCVCGEGKVLYLDAGLRRELRLKTLETILIPADLGEYILCGRMKLIRLQP